MATDKNTPERHQRPLSPFMIGTYYKPQLSSILSIAHRASGVFLSVFGTALLIYWLVSLSQGPAAYHGAMNWLASIPGVLLLSALCFSVYYHFFNGLRHLIWDTGKMLEIKQANRSAVFVLVCSTIAALLTIVTVGAWI